MFDPSISFSELGQTIPNQPGQTNRFWASATIFNGSMIFDRFWSINHLTVIYNGGETFYYGLHISEQSQFHDLSVAQEIRLGEMATRVFAMIL